MKEETPNKKLPPKLCGNTSTPKVASDEILNALLKINNFDSISRESLDIDLSACVTISSDPAAIMNGNSLSSTDFWRVLDENAQTSQLDITSSSDDCSMNSRGAALTEEIDLPTTGESLEGSHTGISCIKHEQPNSFSGTFLRPDPPPTATSLFSPLKKNVKMYEQQRKLKVPPIAPFSENDKLKMLPIQRAIKIEPQSITETVGVNTDSIQKPILSNFCGMRSTNNPSALAVAAQAIRLGCDENGEDSSVISGQLSLYKCLDCDGLLLQGEQEFSTHDFASHRILHKCSMCEREFEQESGLKKHQKAHRSVETRKDAWKKCPDCGKCLKLGSMWMHRKIHSDNKKYGCDICGQKFVQKINLTHHSRVHTAEKPYECPECQKRFQERSHLQRHQKYHAQTRSYRCDKCGKMYKTERCLKVHNLVHLEQRPFACNVCDKSFISNSKLKQHSNIHTGERPFKCNYCPRDFTNFPNWLKHTRRRHKVDHKTGEHLENIPSYCSKKSSKTSKTQKPIDVSPSVLATSIGVSNPQSTTHHETASKAQVKRKKKTTTTDSQLNLPVSSVGIVSPVPSATSTVGTSSVSGKSPKVKRERKQLTPKQVQKSPTQIIKRELLEPKPTSAANAFPDLHCLSITSAEELIMEQALEMEECGLYDVPVSTAGTDNAMSSETAAAMHFKIKNEFAPETIKEEDFTVSLKDITKNRVLCSSLESSPFSSPASIELSSSALNVPSSCTATDMRVPTSTFYMPSSFTLTSQGSLITSLTSNSTASVTTTASESSIAHSVPTLSLQSAQIQTQTLFNHLYLPVTMPLLVRPNQVLPSVDTLFLSAHTNTASFFRNNAVATSASASATGTTTAQRKLS